MQDLIIHGSPGKVIALPDDYLLYRGYEMLRLGKKVEIWGRSLEQYLLSIPGEIYLQELDLSIRAEVQDGRVIATDGQVSLDARKLGDNLIIRSRQKGDWFYPLGLAGKKKVKDYLIDAKIDRFQRDVLPIVTTDTGEIVWIVGERLDDRFKVTARTEKTCILSIIKGG